jgi:hypothetical protein
MACRTKLCYVTLDPLPITTSCDMDLSGMDTRHTILSTLAVVLALALPVEPAQAETLSDVVSSHAMEDVRRDTDRARARNAVNTGPNAKSAHSAGMDPRANFTQLWDTSRGPELLLSWIGANIPGFKMRIMDTTRSFQDIYAYARLTDSSRRQINLQIRVPHPNYELMVRHSTMPQFTQYEPPKLKTVAEEEVEFNGVPGMYYRSDRARCSIVFKIERMGIVNLWVDRCENSSVMMEVAKSLDFKRLNAKLSS